MQRISPNRHILVAPHEQSNYLQEEGDKTSRKESSSDATSDTSSTGSDLGGSGSGRSRVGLSRSAGSRDNGSSLGRLAGSRRLRVARVRLLGRLRSGRLGRLSLLGRSDTGLGLLGGLRSRRLSGLSLLGRSDARLSLLGGSGVCLLGRLRGRRLRVARVRLLGGLRSRRLRVAGVRLLRRLRLGRSPGSVTGVRRRNNDGLSLLGRNRDNVGLSHRADGGRDSVGLGGDMGLLRAVGNLRRTLGDSVDIGGVDS
jgi:hypothetical protein